MDKKLTRKAFEKWAADLKIPSIPESHEQRFLRRLERHKQYKMRGSLLRWAAVALLFLSLGAGFNLIQTQPQPEIIKFYQTETYLTTLIQEQIIQVEQLDFAGADKFIEHVKLQLNRLQEDYLKLYKDWNENQNQPQLINALINNLRIQMELLEEVQKQFTQIQQKDYENI